MCATYPHGPELIGPGNDGPNACFGAVFVVADNGHLGENALDLGGSLGSKASADCQQEQYCRSDFEWIDGWYRHSCVVRWLNLIWINRLKIIKSCVLDGSEFGEGKGGAQGHADFGLMRMWWSCGLLINSFIIRLVNLIIADIWWFSSPGLFLQIGSDKCAYLSIVQKARFEWFFFETSQSRSAHVPF